MGIRKDVRNLIHHKHPIPSGNTPNPVVTNFQPTPSTPIHITGISINMTTLHRHFPKHPPSSAVLPYRLSHHPYRMAAHPRRLSHHPYSLAARSLSLAGCPASSSVQSGRSVTKTTNNPTIVNRLELNREIPPAIT